MGSEANQYKCEYCGFEKYRTRTLPNGERERLCANCKRVPIREYRMPFGKYQYRVLKELPRDYIVWASGLDGVVGNRCMEFLILEEQTTLSNKNVDFDSVFSGDNPYKDLF